MKKLIVVSLLTSLALALTGCDTTTANAPGNTTLGATALGGLAGAAIGSQTGHGSKGTLIGGAIGAAGGYGVGRTMENNRDRQMMQQAPPPPGYGPAPAGYGSPAPRAY